jgi:excisionase family DNA binding protein
MPSELMDGTGEALLVSIDEAARLLALSKHSVYQLLASGELPSFKVGRLRRIPRRAVSEYVDRMLAAPAARDEA